MAIFGVTLHQSQASGEIENCKRISSRRQHLENLVRNVLRVLRHRPFEAIEHERHQVPPARQLVSPHETKVLRRYRYTVVRDHDVFGFQIEHWPVVLVLHREVERDLVHSHAHSLWSAPAQHLAGQKARPALRRLLSCRSGLSVDCRSKQATTKELPTVDTKFLLGAHMA